MNRVDAVYDGNQQLLLLTTLTASNPMMGALFLLGVVSGLRIGDLLAIQKHQLAARMSVVEKKTGKTKVIKLQPKQLEYLREYALTVTQGNLLFPTSRSTVYRWFRSTASDLGINALIGTHTMRKTHLWNVFIKAKGNIDTVRRAANHKYHSTTIDYLKAGISMLVARYACRNKIGIPPSMPEGGQYDNVQHPR
jgi:integrase